MKAVEVREPTLPILPILTEGQKLLAWTAQTRSFSTKQTAFVIGSQLYAARKGDPASTGVNYSI